MLNAAIVRAPKENIGPRHSKYKSCRLCIYWAPYGVHIDSPDCNHPANKTGEVDLISGRDIVHFSCAEMRRDEQLCGLVGKLWHDNYSPLPPVISTTTTRSKRIGLDEI